MIHMHVENKSTPFYGAQTPTALVAMLLASMKDDVYVQRLLRSNDVSSKASRALTEAAVSL